MSQTATDFAAPSRARTTAQRVADGVVAGYIRALASAATEAGEEPPMPRLQQTPARDREPARAARAACGAALSGRRQLPRRRVLLPA